MPLIALIRAISTDTIYFMGLFERTLRGDPGASARGILPDQGSRFNATIHVQ